MSKKKNFKAPKFTLRIWQNVHDEIPDRRVGGSDMIPFFIKIYTYNTDKCIIQGPIKHFADVSNKIQHSGNGGTF